MCKSNKVSRNSNISSFSDCLVLSRDFSNNKLVTPIMMFFYIGILMFIILIGLQSMFNNAATITNSDIVVEYKNKVQISDISSNGLITLKDGTKLENLKLSVGPKLGYGFGKYLVDTNTFVDGMTFSQSLTCMPEYIGVSLMFFIFTIVVCFSIKTRAQYRLMFILTVLIFILDTFVYYLFSYTFAYKSGFHYGLMFAVFLMLSLVKYLYTIRRYKKAYSSSHLMEV